MKMVPATDVKNQFGSYLGEVVYGKEPLVVEKYGKPVAVLVRYEDWIEKTQGSPGSPLLDSFHQLVDDLTKNHPTVKYPSAVELIHRVREEEDA